MSEVLSDDVSCDERVDRGFTLLSDVWEVYEVSR